MVGMMCIWTWEDGVRCVNVNIEDGAGDGHGNNSTVDGNTDDGNDNTDDFRMFRGAFLYQFILIPIHTHTHTHIHTLFGIHTIVSTSMAMESKSCITFRMFAVAVATLFPVPIQQPCHFRGFSTTYRG